jgi:hypothetical protein
MTEFQIMNFLYPTSNFDTVHQAFQQSSDTSLS